MSAFTRIKNSTFAKGAGAYLFASTLNAAIPFLLLPVLTRYLEPSEYGEVAVFQVWVALIGAFCGLSVHGAATRKYYDFDQPDKQMGEFISACLSILLLSSSFVFLLVLPFSFWISKTIGLSWHWLMIGIPFAFCNFLVQIRLGQWQVRKQPKKFGVFQISMGLGNMMLSLILVVALTMGVDGRLMGYSGAILTFGLLAVLLLKRDGLIKPVIRFDYVKEALSYGVPLIPHVMGAFLLVTIDRAVISSKLGLDAAGHYMVAAQLAMVMGIFVESVNKAYVPWLYGKLKDGSQSSKVSVVKFTYGYGAFLVFCAVLAFLIGGEVLVFLAGDRYQPAALLLGWLILAKCMHGMYYTATSYIFYSKRTGLIAKITITTGILNVIMLVLLIDIFGLVGAAWASALSMSIQWLVTWLVAAYLVNMPWKLWRLS